MELVFRAALSLALVGCGISRSIPPAANDDTPPKVIVVFEIVDPDAPEKSGRTVWSFNDPPPKFELGTRARVILAVTATDEESGVQG